MFDGFAFDKDWLTADHLARIGPIAARVAQSHATNLPIQVVRLIGHTDPVGTPQYNIGLGMRRAMAVMNALERAIESELKKLRLTGRVVFVPTSMGESQQVSPDPARNRRVEICLVVTPRPVPPDPKCLQQCWDNFERCKKSSTSPMNCMPRLNTCRQFCGG